MLEVINSNPFTIEEENELLKPYVIFLEKTPSSVAVKNVMAYNSENEIFQIINNEIYILYKNGAGRTKLTNNFFEIKLKIKATTRNWNTVIKLSEL